MSKEKGLKKSLVSNLIKDYSVKAVTRAPVRSTLFGPTVEPSARTAACSANAVVAGLAFVGPVPR